MQRRFIVVLFGFMCYVILNCQRLNLTMALVKMTADQNQSSATGSVSECPAGNYSMSSSVKHGETFHWSRAMQSQIISASFIGFVITQIPGGRLSETLGAKQILTLSLVVASLCNIFSPNAAKYSPYALLILQMIKGMFLGMINPAAFHLTTNWFAKVERCFLTSIVLTGLPFGSFIGGIICGYLCDLDMLSGWPLVFYVFGVLGLMVAVFCQTSVANRPEEDKMIAELELQHILRNQEAITANHSTVPWKAMLSSRATWALIVGLFGQFWFFYYFLSIHTVYLESALHFDITQSGIIASVPYLTQILITWSSSYISDWITKNEYASVTTVRKTCNSLGSLGLAFSTIGVVFAGCNTTLNSALLFVALTLFGFSYSGCITVPSDMSPEFSGTLMGLTSTISCTSSFILPTIVGIIVSDNPKNEQWHRVLYISVGVGLASGLIFNLFGSAALQNWKRDEDERNETETPDVQNADEDSCAIEDTFDGEVMTTRL